MGVSLATAVVSPPLHRELFLLHCVESMSANGRERELAGSVEAPTAEVEVLKGVVGTVELVLGQPGELGEWQYSIEAADTERVVERAEWLAGLCV